MNYGILDHNSFVNLEAPFLFPQMLVQVDNIYFKEQI